MLLTLLLIILPIHLDLKENVVDASTKYVPLKHLSNFKRTLEMQLIDYETNIMLTWTAHCVIFGATRATALAITGTKLLVPVVT